MNALIENTLRLKAGVTERKTIPNNFLFIGNFFFVFKIAHQYYNLVIIHVRYDVWITCEITICVLTYHIVCILCTKFGQNQHVNYTFPTINYISVCKPLRITSVSTALFPLSSSPPTPPFSYDVCLFAPPSKLHQFFLCFGSSLNLSEYV